MKNKVCFGAPFFCESLPTMAEFFYIDGPAEGIIRLPQEEARHLVKSLRKGVGDEIRFTDGKGTLYTAVIEVDDYTDFSARITGSEFGHGRRPYALTIAIAPTKNTDRFEWFVEKATEIGVDTIIPLICSRSERKDIRTDRLRKIAVSAMKQSCQTYLPDILEPMAFSSVVSRTADQRFICHLEVEPFQLADACQPNGSVLLLIGPEGDFTSEEIRLALESGFRCAALGNTRLRTETAGVAACVTVSTLNV